MQNNREYIHPAEELQEKHEKKRLKKKKKKRFIFMLIILLLLIAVLLFMNYLGLGLGGGKGEGGESSGKMSSAVQENISADESSEAEKTVIQLRISGSTYIYGDKVYTLEEFKDFAAVMDKDTAVIELCDDNAVANAVEKMHSMLDELGIPYTDTVYTDLSSKSEAEQVSEAAER